jgi:hypothetical protein
MVSVLTLSVVDHWWCNGYHAHLECGRSDSNLGWVKLKTMKLIFVTSPLSTQQ